MVYTVGLPGTAGRHGKFADNGIDAFAAALILIAGHMCPLVTGDFHDLAFNTAWSRCILILQSHAEQMPSCERARAFLEALKTKVCHDADTMGDILSANEDGKSYKSGGYHVTTGY